MATKSESRFHIDYTKSHLFVTWEELRCLCKALGYPSDVLEKTVQAFQATSSTGISIQEMKQKFFKSKDFEIAFSFTFNHHSHEWNEELINIGLHLVTHRGLSFGEMYTVRTAYSFYESSDSKGLKINERTLLRCLKMCNRVIAPKKLMHRIKHKRASYQEEGRIQLGEFLELVLWADLYGVWEKKVRELKIVNDKDDRLMYELNNFYQVLHHKDAKLHTLLNKMYRKEEWTFLKEITSKVSKFQDPPVNQQPRISFKERAAQSFAPYKAAVKQSEFDVTRSSASGYVLERRPQTAPACLAKHKAEQKKKWEANRAASQRLQLLKQSREPSKFSTDADDETSSHRSLVKHFYSQKLRAQSAVSAKTPQSVIAPKTVRERPKTAPLVTDVQEAEVVEKMDAVRFDLETVAMRHREYVREDLEYLRPGFWDRAALRPQEAPPPPPPPAVVRRPARPSAHFLYRMSAAASGNTLPSHRRVCSAPKQGVHNFNYRSVKMTHVEDSLPRTQSPWLRKRRPKRRKVPKMGSFSGGAAFLRQSFSTEDGLDEDETEEEEEVEEESEEEEPSQWPKDPAEIRVWSNSFVPHVINLEFKNSDNETPRSTVRDERLIRGLRNRKHCCLRPVSITQNQ